MEGTETVQGGGNSSVFAGGFAGLTPVTESGVTLDTTTAPTGVTEQTTEAPKPTGTTEQTTEAPAQEGGEENQGEATIIDTLRTQYGIEDALDNNIEGVQSLIEKVSAKAKAEAIKAQYDANPVLGQLAQHIEAGRSIESFFEVKQIEANTITLPTLTGDEKKDAEIKQYYKDVIKANYKQQGLSDKQIGRIIESAELEGTIEDDAKEAAGAWNGRVTAQSQAAAQKAEADRLQAIEDDKKIVTSINTLIDGGKLNGAIIPQDDRQPLKDFMLKQDEKGFTPRDYAFAKLTLEQQAIIDYLVFKDFKLKGFVAPAAVSLDSLKGNNPLAGNNNNNQGGSGNAAETKPLPAFNFNGLIKQQ